jgi:ankyrin repeat protein
VNAKDPKGMTPLGYALTWGAMTGQKPEVTIALVTAGANINAKDTDGGTPLMYATNNENAHVLIPAFLKAGADAKAKSNEGKTALDYAKANEKLKDTDALKQLEEASK